MTFVRDIKLSIIDGSENELINLFKSITKDMKEVKHKVYETCDCESIWHNGESWIFYQNIIRKKFICNFYVFWYKFHKRKIPYTEISEITNILLKEINRLEIDGYEIILAGDFETYTLLENIFNSYIESQKTNN